MSLFSNHPIKELISCFLNLDLDLAVNEKPLPKQIKILIIEQMTEQSSVLEMALFLQKIYNEGMCLLKSSKKSFKKDFEFFIKHLFLDLKKIIQVDEEISQKDFSFFCRILKTKYRLSKTGIKDLILDLNDNHPSLLRFLEKFGICSQHVQRFLFLHEISSLATIDEGAVKKFRTYYPFHFAGEMSEKQFSHLIKDLKETVSFNWP